MTPQKFIRSSRLSVSREDAYAWHARPGAFMRLCPPWQSIEVLSDDGEIRDGSRVTFRVKKGPISLKWVAEHQGVNPPEVFCDRQVKGPFHSWLHAHRFLEEGEEGTCRLEDDIEYALPIGRLGQALQGRAVRKDLERMFDYRHAVTRRDLSAHGKFADRPRLKVAISGASGLVGEGLSAFLTTGGHSVKPISRRASPEDADAIAWDTTRQTMDVSGFEGVDAVVHLAGENIAGGRWSAERMRRIEDSRIQGTRALVDALAQTENRPKVLVSASAIGIYGDRGDEALDETSAIGTGFLAELGEAWEAEARRAEDFGVRVVRLRFGIVLSPRGGALAKMLPAFRSGVAGTLADGSAWMSWISIEDVIRLIHQALQDEDYSGPLNAVSPGAVTNREFTKTLGRVLKRPTLLPVPRFALRTLFGRMADEALLASAKVQPRRATELGYEFVHSDLEATIRFLLGLRDPGSSA